MDESPDGGKIGLAQAGPVVVQAFNVFEIICPDNNRIHRLRHSHSKGQERRIFVGVISDAAEYLNGAMEIPGHAIKVAH